MTSPKLEMQEGLSQPTLNDEFCQICQFPFKLIRILTPESHIVKCRRRTITPKRECAEGISCFSSMESHYQIYSHEKLRKHRSEYGSSNSSTQDSSNGYHKLFQSLHGFDSKSSLKLSQTGKKKKIKLFAESFVDLTDIQSSEEFKSSQSSTRSYNSRNFNNKKIKSSPLTSSNSANTSHITSRTSLGKHKLDKNETVPLSQTQKVKKTPVKRQKIKIEKPMSENPWSIASSSKIIKTPQKRDDKTENNPFPQSKKPKKTPIKNNKIKIQKPITENPWTITASQISKVRTPVKKPLVVIDLTEEEDAQSSPFSKTLSNLEGNSTGIVCNNRGLNGESSTTKKMLFSNSDKRKNETSEVPIHATSSDKRCNIEQKNRTDSAKNGQSHSANDLKNIPFVKLERISPKKYPQLDALNSNPATSSNHDQNDMLDFSSNDIDVPFHSTQIPGQKIPDKSLFISAESLDTQDSEEWSIPLCRGPGFVPFSPINKNKSSLSPPGIFLDSNSEESIKIDTIKFTKDGDLCVDKNKNYIKGCSNLEKDRIVNLEATDRMRNSSDKIDPKTALNCENMFGAEKTQNFEFVKKIGDMASDMSRHDTNATDNGSDTTLGDGSDASDDEMLECSLLAGLSQSKTLPFSQMNFPKSDDKSSSEAYKIKNDKKGQQEKSNTLAKNVKKCVTVKSDEVDNVQSSEIEVKKVKLIKPPASDNILPNGIKNGEKLLETSSNSDLPLKQPYSTNKAIVNDGASTSHQNGQTFHMGNKSKKTSDDFANVKKWINSSSTSKKQGDVGSMLFGFKPKVKEVPKKTENQKETKGRYNGGFYGGNKQRTCPFYKKVAGTDIAVDAFSYGVIEGIQFYFLSHFHADHYMGLTKKHWKHKVFCSQVTGNLVSQKIGLSKDLILCLPLWEEIEVGNVGVTLLEANHCPGAVLFLFKLRNNKVFIHTGDFRANAEMERYSALQGVRVDTLYLDTTYLNPDYQFPLQNKVIEAAVSIATESFLTRPKTLIVVGTYLIGKERIFAAIARAIESPVFVTAEKYRTVQCLEDEDLKSMVTRNSRGAKVHVLAMRQMNVKDLKLYLSRNKEFDQLVAIKPTGWTHNSNQPNLNQIKPVVSGQVKIYGLPYSEHSSFEDLRRFVKFLRPSRIVPTVNVGKKETRDMMNKYLDKWKIGLDP